ncbi:MAG TPA: M23 family metallopeptidase, partial [Actinomycetota bacterium]|nr:M23 family metallopeptidase [Actinomycetota bacterium]
TAPVVRSASIDLVQPVAGPITRHFEPPPTPYAAGHRGIDFGAPVGTRVVAAAAGTVSFAGQVGGSLFVSVDHAGGLRTTYSFLSAILVKKGQAVVQGQPIATSGRGAAGEQPNLHFGLRSGADYLDPEPYLLASIRRNLWRVIWLAPIP